MYYDENDNLNNTDENLDDEVTSDESQEIENEEEKVDVTDDKEELVEDIDEEDTRVEPDVDHTQEERFYEQMRRERSDDPYEKPKDVQPQNNNNNQNHSYMSKKSVGLIVALCVVLALICSICVSVVSASMRRANQSTQTTETAQQTTSKNNVINDNSTKNQETKTPVTTETKEANPVTFETLDVKVEDVGGQELSVKEVFKKVNASVVIIKSTNSSGYSLGSGVVITEDGYIITNYHVANPSYTKVEVQFADGLIYEATFLIGDENADVALLKVDKENCAYAQLANSDQVEVGDVAIVIGNALGRGITLTSGYVSALERTLSIDGNVMTLLQTDATINSGNSGGGLFNEYGQLIAIVNAKTGGSTVEGTGYAIPINTALRVINDLQQFGYVTGKARLGIRMTYLGSSLLSSYTYIQVTNVTENASADRAGIKVNDIIYKIGSDTITSSTALNTALAKYSVGDTVDVVVLRPTKDISEFRVQSWFGQITYDYDAYLNACEQITLSLTFVEFNPN